jgi:RNA methyltransferase, TrmH family
LKQEELKNAAKLKQKKYREEKNQFLVEGIHLIDECLKSKYYKKSIEKIFIRKDFDNANIIRKIKDIETEYLKSADFNKISETENSQGIIGIVNFANKNPKVTSKIICALDNINDPGNLGTILRSCWWFGINDVILSKDSVDVFNSKVIRASQGAIFNLNIQNKVALKKELIISKEKGYEILLTDLSANNIINDFKFHKNQKYVLVFGNEANGISEEIKSVPGFTKIKIDSCSECESLNVATSAGIVLYEVNKSLK